jgi:single-strand DNA-binding protein
MSEMITVLKLKLIFREETMSINKVILVGNLGKNPEVHKTPTGKTMATFTLATNENYTDKQGVLQTLTEWHSLIAWGRLAETCGKFLHKGKQVYIEGKLQTRSYEGKDGNKKYSTQIVVNEMRMLGKSTENTWEVSKSYEPKPGPVDILGDAIEFSEEDRPF